MGILIYYKKHGAYKEHRYYEQPDAYGQHSGQVVEGYFKADDLKQEGNQEWAGWTPVFKNKTDAENYADMAIMN